MKIAVVGVGALGGVWAAKLASAGHEVWGIDASPETVAAIRGNGVIIEDRVSGTTTATPIEITSEPAAVGTVDALFVFVKHHQTRAAATAAMAMVDAGTSVCSLQNGWGNSDILASIYPGEQIVMGITYQSATVLAPGRVAHTASRPSFVGPYLPAGDPERASGHRLGHVGFGNGSDCAGRYHHRSLEEADPQLCLVADGGADQIALGRTGRSRAIGG